MEEPFLTKLIAEFPQLLAPPCPTGGSNPKGANAAEFRMDEGKAPFVLVADDEQLVAETLVEILIGEGFRATSVLDGMSAVSSARELRPDILLADVLMPGLNGVEVAKQVRQFLPNTRIVLFSGHAETAELLSSAKRDGHVFEVLAKPLNPSLLLEVLRRGPEG